MIHACIGEDCLHITPRQIDTIKWIGRGKSNIEIAQLMGCAVSTIKNGLMPLFDELGASNRTGLVFAALRAGLLSMDDL